MKTKTKLTLVSCIFALLIAVFASLNYNPWLDALACVGMICFIVCLCRMDKIIYRRLSIIPSMALFWFLLGATQFVNLPYNKEYGADPLFFLPLIVLGAGIWVAFSGKSKTV